MRPPSVRLIVSTTGRTGSAAPVREAASRTRSITSSETNGRAASWIRMSEASTSADRTPEPALSRRVSPPAHHRTDSRLNHSGGASTFAAGSTTTTSPMPGCRSNALTLHRRSGNPPRGRNCFGDPRRSPLPAATITADAPLTLCRPGPSIRPPLARASRIGRSVQIHRSDQP